MGLVSLTSNTFMLHGSIAERVIKLKKTTGCSGYRSRPSSAVVAFRGFKLEVAHPTANSRPPECSLHIFSRFQFFLPKQKKSKEY